MHISHVVDAHGALVGVPTAVLMPEHLYPSAAGFR